MTGATWRTKHAIPLTKSCDAEDSASHVKGTLSGPETALQTYNLVPMVMLTFGQSQTPTSLFQALVFSSHMHHDLHPSFRVDSAALLGSVVSVSYAKLREGNMKADV